jgi:hypothetical protein
MNIYIASSYRRMEEMHKHARKLTDAGHKVTARWVYGGTEDMTREDGAIADFEDVVKADMVLVFTEGPLNCPHEQHTGGHHVEFGMGLALNKRVVLIGPRVNIFHHLPHVQVFDTLKAFLNVLNKEKSA